MEVNSTNTQAVLRNMHSEGDSRAQYMALMAEQLAAANQRIAELEAAIESYRTSINWGAAYSWLQHGAPTEGEGIAMAKRIIHLHVNADALAGGAS